MHAAMSAVFAPASCSFNTAIICFRIRSSVVEGDPPHFGSAAAIQRCHIQKARNIMERLPKEHHATTRRVLRQAWELDDADKAEKLIRNLARRLGQQWPGVAASILEGLDEILTVRLKLPKELRRSSPVPTSPKT